MITAFDKNTALILIDLQNGVVGMPLAHPVQQVLANCAKLADAFHQAGLPVVMVNVVPSGDWLKSRKDAAPRAQTTMPANWTEIVPDIRTQPDDIFITKPSWNAFHGTPLHEELQKRDVTGIVLAGIATSIGVEGTARAASALAYNLTFANDAMTDGFAEAHTHSFKYIFPRIGEIDTTDNILGFVDKVGL